MLPYIIRMYQENLNTTPKGQIPCKDCEKVYVGQTGHSVDQRIKEHKRALASLDYSMSAVAEHAIKTDHNIGWEEFEILDSHPELQKSCYLKSWHIR